ncbi:DUF2267 domain-containing protein [Streptomyces sp900105245]|uniref:DUF2267 domain-containing protein n=1 Tax=Streptomyces sp. 900105245 TaxID=3154379 RepID=UPI00332C27A0
MNGAPRPRYANDGSGAERRRAYGRPVRSSPPWTRSKAIRGTTDRIERFGHHESVRRVAERTMLKEEEADRGVRTVLAVLREAISEKEFNDLMSQLGTDFSQALESAE